MCRGQLCLLVLLMVVCEWTDESSEVCLLPLITQHGSTSAYIHSLALQSPSLVLFTSECIMLLIRHCIDSDRLSLVKMLLLHQCIVYKDCIQENTAQFHNAQLLYVSQGTYLFISPSNLSCQCKILTMHYLQPQGILSTYPKHFKTRAFFVLKVSGYFYKLILFLAIWAFHLLYM